MKKSEKVPKHLFIVKNKLSHAVAKGLGDYDGDHICFIRDMSPYVFDLIHFYRTQKRKFVESNDVIFDWSNTALLDWWIENDQDLSLVPDRFFIMAEEDPAKYKNPDEQVAVDSIPKLK